MTVGIQQDLMTAIASVVRVGETFDIQDIADLVPKHEAGYVSKSMAGLADSTDPVIERVDRGRYRLLKVRTFRTGSDESKTRRKVIDTEPCPICWQTPSLSGTCGCD